MKKIICLLIFIASSIANAQSFTVFDVDTTNFPTIKAKFFAFDADGKQITNLSPSDFEIAENGTPRTVTNVSCPIPKPPEKVSVAMSLDVSSSMSYSDFGEIPVELGKTTAKGLVNLIAMPPSEFALQTCDDFAYILYDFTTNKSKILSAIETIFARVNNDFVEQLLNPRTGLLNIAKNGKNKRVAVIYTDAWWYKLSNYELQRCKDTCSKYNIQFFAVIYSRPEAEPYGIKNSLQQLANATGGILYDGITSTEAAKDIANRIKTNVQVGDPCTIEWKSGFVCNSNEINVNIKCIPSNFTATTKYITLIKSIEKLEFNPSSVKFLNPKIGVKVEQKITVTARNVDFNVTNITSNNSSFYITPTSFMLNKGESRELTVSYVPADSGYNYCKFIFENDVCKTNYYVSGGWKGIKPKLRTLKLLHPNGGEVFVAGTDTVITWEGVLPEEKVKIEYSTNNGFEWLTIADSAMDLSYKWRVPKTPSNQCLARITANAATRCYCNNPNVEICGKIWMGCNLDVEIYRNGDPIRHAQTSEEWVDAGNKKEGAWCYYNNDPEMGAIYGKLYNWYAVNDPRGLAPEGWHIPTQDEWTELSKCLGGDDVAGGKLKSTGTIEDGDGLWYIPNEGATNEIGFSALPGGYRDPVYNGAFRNIGYGEAWWSSTALISETYPLCYGVTYCFARIDRGTNTKEFGCSVRCVKD